MKIFESMHESNEAYKTTVMSTKSSSFIIGSLDAYKNNLFQILTHVESKITQDKTSLGRNKNEIMDKVLDIISDKVMPYALNILTIE